MQDFTHFESWDTDNGYADVFRNNVNLDPKLISVDPNGLWINLGTYNLEVQPGSPAIDRGLATGMPTKDIRGTTRIGNDIGAYEYNSGSDQVPPNVPNPARL